MNVPVQSKYSFSQQFAMSKLCMIAKELAKLMQKNALGSLPTPLASIFRDQTRPSQIQSRSSINIIPASYRFTKCEQAIRCTAPKAWNSLPNEIKFSISADSSPAVNNNPSRIGPFISELKRHALSSIDFI